MSVVARCARRGGDGESLIDTAAGFVGQAISDLQEIDPVRDGSVVAPAGALSSYYWSNPSQHARESPATVGQ
jgi:hypothetical protein